VAGVPAQALTRLRFGASYALAAAAGRLRERLTAEGADLSDRLHARIGALVDHEQRGALLALRRKVYQGRRPAARDWNGKVAAALDETDLVREVDAFVARLDRHDAMVARLPGVLAAETGQRQDVLRDIVRRPLFSRGLSYASPDLYAEAVRWTLGDGRGPRKQTLARLAQYAARAAAKTSPFSGFTSSGTGAWVGGGPPVHLRLPAPVHGVLELHGFQTRRLVTLFSDDPRLAGSRRLRVNPSATLDGDTVRFLGRPPGEPILAVPATPSVRACLRALTELANAGPAHAGHAGGELRAGGDGVTVEAIRGRLDSTAQPAGRIDLFLAGLVELGLLEFVAPVADLAADPIGELADWLTTHSAQHSTEHALLDRLRRLSRDPSPDDQPDRQRELDATIRALLDNAPTRPAPTPDPARGGWTAHESTVYVEPIAELSAAWWTPALADLDTVRRALAIIDPALPYRLALGEYCAERFGPGTAVPLLTLHEAVARELAGTRHDGAAQDLATFGGLAPAPDRALAGARLPLLRELAALRGDLNQLLRRAPGADGVTHVDPAVVERMAAGWPACIEPPPSVAFYVQAVPDAGLVVNLAHGGHGRGRSRVLHLIQRAGGPLAGAPAPGTQATEAGGTRGAELGGLFGFAPNVRLATAPYEIDYPFTTSRRPAAERIPLNDLVVVADPATGLARLRCTRLGTRVRALHLGLMAESLLPPAARLLAVAFGASHYLHPSLPVPPPEPTDLTGPVTVLPRVAVGRVVLRRSRWIVPAGRVPVRAAAETDAGYLLRLVGWQRGLGLPTACFVRVVTRGDAMAWLLSQDHKPLYVDFANWYLTLAFERLVRRAGPVVIFEEALPALDDAAGPSPDTARATEFIVEISGPGRDGTSQDERNH